MQKESVRIEVAARLELKKDPDDDQREHHRVRAQSRRRNPEPAQTLFAEVVADIFHGRHAACPVAAAITFSAVASARVNSPVSSPSWSTMTRSERPRTSGSSDETSTIASPSEASRVIC